MELVRHDGSSPTQDTDASKMHRKVHQKCPRSTQHRYARGANAHGRPGLRPTVPDSPSPTAQSPDTVRRVSRPHSPAPHPCQAQAHRGSPVLPWALARAPRGPARPDPRLGPRRLGARRGAGGGVRCAERAVRRSRIWNYMYPFSMQLVARPPQPCHYTRHILIQPNLMMPSPHCAF